jgi:hypothetical protein
MKALTRPLLIFSILAALIPGACKKDNTITYVSPNRKPPVVNAGPSQMIAFPVDSVLLTGAVTDTGSKVVSYLWSEVSGPDVPVISSEGSISTKVHYLTPGSYVFQLTATDTFGLTGADTMMVTVTPPTSITLNSNSNLSEIEFVGNSAGNPEQSNNNTLELGAETWTIGGVTVGVRSVFRFDLSSLPAIPVKSAKLTLYSNPTPGTANLTTPNFGSSNAMYIQRINVNWTTPGASWATQPTVDPTDEVSIPQTNASTLDLVDVDVTKLVNAMRTSGNYGFMIRLQNEVILNSRIFCSSKYADATKHPKLVLSY